MAGVRGQGTGDRGQVTADREQGTGNREQSFPLRLLELAGPRLLLGYVAERPKVVDEVPDVLVGELIAPGGHGRPADAVRDEGEELRVGVIGQVLAEVGGRGGQVGRLRGCAPGSRRRGDE